MHGPRARCSRPGAAAKLISWQTWDRAAAESLAAGGRIVFVDVTADWCFTCKVNERFVLDTPPVADAFTAHGVVAMRADWTNRDAAIADALAEHDRAGVPLYLVYPASGGEPKLLPQLLTSGMVAQALREAANG